MTKEDLSDRGSSLIDVLLHRPVGWMDGSGEHASIVLSSRVRLARNFRDIPFSQRAQEVQLQAIQDHVLEACGQSVSMEKAAFLNIEALPDLDRQFMMERHLISPALLEKHGPRGILIGEEETVSIMINEEDHLRLQTIHSGFEPRNAWQDINRLDDELALHLDYAFSDQFGFLTACPTNTGTGLRASVLIHLPALVLTQEIDKILRGIAQVGLTVRGFYGEGTAVAGNLFQISNQTTLGQSEEDILDSLERVTRQIIGYEEEARKTMLRDARSQIEDKIWRAYGILRQARVLTSQECMSLSSAVRLGVAMDLVVEVRIRALNQLAIWTQPAHLQKRAGRAMAPEERDVYRADFVRQILAAE